MFYLLLIITILTVLLSIKPFLKQKLLQSFNIDETIFLKYIIKFLPIVIFIFVKYYLTKKTTTVSSFSFIQKINFKTISLLLLNLSISLISGYLFLTLLKNYDLSIIIPILSPLIIILTITIDYYINKRTFTSKYYIAVSFVIIAILLLQNENKKLNKFHFI